jgi:chemotaxis signal transduction protein
VEITQERPQIHTGIVVDRVQEVLDIEAACIESRPSSRLDRYDFIWAWARSATP